MPSLLLLSGDKKTSLKPSHEIMLIMLMSCVLLKQNIPNELLASITYKTYFSEPKRPLHIDTVLKESTSALTYSHSCKCLEIIYTAVNSLQKTLFSKNMSTIYKT